MRRSIVRLHRWFGLAAAALWLLQAVTGLLIVFHWEIDDLTVPGAHRTTDLAAIERRADAFANAGTAVTSIWTSAGLPDRYDVSLENGDSARINGAGTVLRLHRAEDGLADGGLMDRLVVLHQSLLAGEAGHWVVGLSGLLLIFNILFGLVAAWPRRGYWRRALTPVRPRQRAPRYYSWHRALGLWVGLPALIVVAAGTTLALSDALDGLAADAPPAATAPLAQPLRIGMAEAVRVALGRHPGAQLSGVDFATPASPTWSIRLKQRGELVRAYGKTSVIVSAVDGRIVGDVDALRSAPARWLSDHLFSIHTGGVAGLPGRLAMLLVGLWLATMTALGITLWAARRSR